jgi:enterochelin esterase-like enzyme
MDLKVSAGEFPSFIVVMPYDPGWEDPNTGKYDRAISEELVPWIDSQYSVKNDRAFRAIGGLSRGSAWAFHAGIRYSKIFSIVGIHSPAFFRDDKRKMESILDALSSSSYPVRFILDVGTKDPELNYAKIFEGFLTKDSIEHSWDNPSGTHSEAYWRENLESYLEKYSRDW